MAEVASPAAGKDYIFEVRAVNADGDESLARIATGVITGFSMEDPHSPRFPYSIWPGEFLTNLSENSAVMMAELGVDRFNVKATVRRGANIGSMKISLTGGDGFSHSRQKNEGPLSLFDDEDILAVPGGNYTISATAYSGPGLTATTRWTRWTWTSSCCTRRRTRPGS